MKKSAPRPVELLLAVDVVGDWNFGDVKKFEKRESCWCIPTDECLRTGIPARDVATIAPRAKQINVRNREINTYTRPDDSEDTHTLTHARERTTSSEARTPYG